MQHLTSYTSYLVRLWRETASEGGETRKWRGEVEHIQSGQQWSLARGEELLAFLQRQKEETDGSQTAGD